MDYSTGYAVILNLYCEDFYDNDICDFWVGGVKVK